MTLQTNTKKDPLTTLDSNETGVRESTVTKNVLSHTFFRNTHGDININGRNIISRANIHTNERIMETTKTNSGAKPFFKQIYANGRFNSCKPPTIIW